MLPCIDRVKDVGWQNAMMPDCCTVHHRLSGMAAADNVKAFKVGEKKMTGGQALKGGRA